MIAPTATAGLRRWRCRSGRGPGGRTDSSGIDRELREKVSRIRPHASFFDWPVKVTKELGVVRTLVENLSADDPLAPITEVRPGEPNRAPDAIATRADGERVGIEVTELVDEEVTTHNVQAMRKTVGQDPLERMKHTVQRVWDEAGVRTAIQALLTEKDGKTLHGGPFKEYVVVIHTDEMMLTHDDTERWLCDHMFTGFRQITSTYLLFSYDPATDRYPYIRLGVAE